MNFSGLDAKSVPGKLLRRLLGRLPPDRVVPILQGRLRGRKWIAGAGNHGCWLGSYEFQARRRFEKIVRPGWTVYDAGAHVGFYTLLASVLVGPAGQVAAFEPLERNLAYLRAHLELNRVNNVRVVAAAVSDCEGMASLQMGSDSYTGRLAAGGVPVRTVSIDAQVESGELPPPDLVKIDVEGAELLVLTGARATLARTQPVIFLSTHSPELAADCTRLLESLGYQVSALQERRPSGEAELLAVFPEAGRL